MARLIRKQRVTTLNSLMYGWIQHYLNVIQQLVQPALENYLIPPEIVQLVMLYMNRLKMRFAVENFTFK